MWAGLGRWIFGSRNGGIAWLQCTPVLKEKSVREFARTYFKHRPPCFLFVSHLLCFVCTKLVSFPTSVCLTSLTMPPWEVTRAEAWDAGCPSARCTLPLFTMEV